MPFLGAIAPAIAGGVASAGTGALINSAIGSGGQKGSGFQAPSLGATQFGSSVTGAQSPQLTPQQIAQIDALPGLSQAQRDQMKSGTQAALGVPGPAQTQLVLPTTGAQAQQAAQQANAGIQGQQDFVNALQGQNGIANQSSVYNQFQDVANGKGPNPAQAMLAQQTGQNIASQAALMAGQRGSGANAGLIARQAGQQGGNLQQQAVGQGATLQAQQSLGALGQLSGIAGQQVGQEQNALTAYNQAAQGNQGQLLNSLQGQNSVISGQQNAQTAANAGIAGINAGAQNSATAGLASGLGSGLAAALVPGKASAPSNSAVGAGGSGFGDNNQAFLNYAKAEGGLVKAMAEGGPVSALGQHFHKIKMAKGGKVPAMVSPGEKIIDKKDVKAVAEGKKSPMSAKTVPGKAKVAGAKNSYANDTVPKNLNEGDIVLPRSVTQSKDPAKEAHKFVTEIMRKKGSLK